MYTNCEIEWVSDGAVWYVVIKANDKVDEHDEMIFFYGLSRDDLIKARDNREVLEDEWRVLEVFETYDRLLW